MIYLIYMSTIDHLVHSHTILRGCGGSASSSTDLTQEPCVLNLRFYTGYSAPTWHHELFVHHTRSGIDLP